MIRLLVALSLLSAAFAAPLRAQTACQPSLTQPCTAPSVQNKPSARDVAGRIAQERRERLRGSSNVDVIVNGTITTEFAAYPRK